MYIIGVVNPFHLTNCAKFIRNSTKRLFNFERVFDNETIIMFGKILQNQQEHVRLIKLSRIFKLFWNKVTSIHRLFFAMSSFVLPKGSIGLILYHKYRFTELPGNVLLILSPRMFLLDLSCNFQFIKPHSITLDVHVASITEHCENKFDFRKEHLIK
eukprot:snap_masked-scaffold_8-processed-gene-2.30-mRNA-1 protein AED:1.00 eAED:1.00 QI:0/0/0/0/1/1/2/0/156